MLDSFILQPKIKSESHSVVSDSFRPHGLQPTRIVCPRNSPGRKMSGQPFPSPGDLPQPGIERGSPVFQADSSVVSDSVRPHRRQPTRLPRPWDFPGRSTGVGCHFLLHLPKLASIKGYWSQASCNIINEAPFIFCKSWCISFSTTTSGYF